MPKALSEKGFFITLEGGEGAGKSTQIGLLRDFLEGKGFSVICTREPGGTPQAEAIRNTILSGAIEELGARYEAEMFAAARLDHVENLIAPSLAEGKVVLCDRFIDSTRVYQGYTGSVEMSYLHALESLVCDGAWPDLTLILDLDPQFGMKRANARRAEDGAPDRFEKEPFEIQTKRREGFLKIAEDEPERCCVVDASGDAQSVHERISQLVIARMKQKTDG